MTIDVEALADRLITAVNTGTSMAPFATEIGLSVDAAYDVQDAVLQRHDAPITAAKIGLTSKVKQQQVNVSEPLYGWMTQSMLFGTGGRGEFDRSWLIQPRAEPEMAFRTGAELAGPEVTAEEVLAATESIMPAIDILDSRFTGYEFTLADVTADNSSAGGYILGEESEIVSDLSLCGCVLTKNGEVIETAAGAAVLDHPAESMAWFVRKLHQRGRTLPAGTVVCAGAWTAATPMEPGDVVAAEFDRYGSVEVVCR